MSSRQWRKIHLYDQVWEWKYGNFLLLRDPQKKLYKVPLTEITGWTWDQIERGCWKHYFSVKPAQIREYILRTFDKLIFF